MRLITLNGVKLLVYINGMILRYRDKANGRFKKGWGEAKGSIDNTTGYLRTRLNRKDFLKHRIVGYAFLGLDIDNPKQIIDHIDRNKQNNNMNNLRIVSHQENQFNTNAKGYYLNNNKWRASIRINTKPIHIGCFKTEEEAHKAYLQAKEKYHIIPEAQD